MSRGDLALGSFVAALALLAGCGGSSAPESAAPAPPPELIRLWRPPAAVGVQVVPAAQAQATPRTLWQTSFDGRDGSAWYRVVPAPPEKPGGEKGLQYRAVELNFGPVPLNLASGLAAATSVPVLGGQAVSVQIVARTLGGAPDAGERPVALVLEQRESFDPGLRLSAQDAADLLSPKRHANHALLMTPSETPATLRADFVTDRATTSLQFNLVAPEDAAARTIVERVELQALPLDALLARGGNFPDLQRLGDPALPSVRLTLDRDEREGLLARPGERVVFTLPPCASAQRLELSTGVAPRDGGLTGAVRLAVSLQPAGGEARTLLERRRAAPASEDEAAWQDELLELPALPRGGTLAFSCEGEGEEPPLAVFGHPTLSRPRAATAPNVVLISLDTLRPDRLGCYGGPGALSPRIDALAAQGLRFEHAYSTSSYTLPSHASLLTGTWPALHGAVDVYDRLDPSRSPFLAKMLAAAGWQTAAFTGGGYVSPECGMQPGFDRYGSNDPVWALDSERGRLKLATMAWERAPQETALLRRYAAPAIERWIADRAGGPPFFLFLHTYIVHNYAPDLAALGKHGLLGPQGEQTTFNHQERDGFNDGKVSGDEARDRIRGEYLAYYDATIDMADRFVGQVLDALERAGLAENTLVVLVSDHGEEFGEHAFFGHGETLDEEAVRVPLIARLPAGAAGPAPGSVLQPMISLADVAPWILRTCGLQPDPRMQMGAPLGPDTASPPGRTSLWMELDTRISRLSALREGPLKLHMGLGGATRGLQPGAVRLFDLAADPGERTDLAEQRRSDVNRLAAALGSFHDFTEALHPRPSTQADDPDYSPEQQRRLEGMGYFGGRKKKP